MTPPCFAELLWSKGAGPKVEIEVDFRLHSIWDRATLRRVSGGIAQPDGRDSFLVTVATRQTVAEIRALGPMLRVRGKLARRAFTVEAPRRTFRAIEGVLRAADNTKRPRPDAAMCFDTDNPVGLKRIEGAEYANL